MAEFEKFTNDDLNALRDDLRGTGLDSFQAAQLLTAFLAARGYGSSNDVARAAATRLEAAGCPLPGIQAELEAMAWSM